MIDAKQLRELVVRPILKYLDPFIPYSMTAENLVMGTAAVESKLGTYLKQLEDGPALGIYQMEPVTHEDIYLNFLIYRNGLYHHIKKLSISAETKAARLPIPPKAMIGNLSYATAMCRVHYFRVPERLPDNTPFGMGEYWKKYYNTEQGKGTVEKFVKCYRSFVGNE